MLTYQMGHPPPQQWTLSTRTVSQMNHAAHFVAHCLELCGGQAVGGPGLGVVDAVVVLLVFLMGALLERRDDLVVASAVCSEAKQERGMSGCAGSWQRYVADGRSDRLKTTASLSDDFSASLCYYTTAPKEKVGFVMKEKITKYLLSHAAAAAAA